MRDPQNEVEIDPDNLCRECDDMLPITWIGRYCKTCRAIQRADHDRDAKKGAKYD